MSETTTLSAVVALAKQLMAQPSVTPLDAGCQNIISELLIRSGFHCESMRFGEVDNLWARFGKNEPLLVFAGHTDVVPPGPEDDWTTPPFAPVIRAGNIYGRGASDMKSAIAAMLIATEKFIKEQPNFQGSIAFLITSDEEGPSVDGTKRVIEVLQQRGIKINYCVIGEPSSDKTVGDQIRIGRRGSLHGTLTVHGIQGHVAHPQFALNPIHASVLALHELAQTEWDHGNENFPPTTFQITTIFSGTGALNVIPGHLKTLFNFRYSPALTEQQIQTRVEALFKKHGLTYAIEWKSGAHPFITNKGKLIAATQQAIKEITGLEVKLSTGGGTSDGRFIAPTGAEVLELGTTHETAHHVDEHVKVTDIEKLAEIYHQILHNIFD